MAPCEGHVGADHCCATGAPLPMARRGSL